MFSDITLNTSEIATSGWFANYQLTFPSSAHAKLLECGLHDGVLHCAEHQLDVLRVCCAHVPKMISKASKEDDHSSSK